LRHCFFVEHAGAIVLRAMAWFDKNTIDIFVAVMQKTLAICECFNFAGRAIRESPLQKPDRAAVVVVVGNKNYGDFVLDVSEQISPNTLHIHHVQKTPPP